MRGGGRAKGGGSRHEGGGGEAGSVVEAAREGRDDGRGEGEDGLAVLVGVFPLEPSHPTGTTSSQPMHPVAA